MYSEYEINVDDDDDDDYYYYYYYMLLLRNVKFQLIECTNVY